MHTFKTGVGGGFGILDPGTPASMPPARHHRTPRRPAPPTPQASIEGKGTGKLRIAPVLLSKGSTRLALYGLGAQGAASSRAYPASSGGGGGRARRSGCCLALYGVTRTRDPDPPLPLPSQRAR